MNDTNVREPSDQEILDILAEECAEVIHIISKIRRFGIHETRRGQDKTNSERLHSELMDFMTMYVWATERDLVRRETELEFQEITAAKRDKVRRYCAYGDTTR